MSIGNELMVGGDFLEGLGFQTGLRPFEIVEDSRLEDRESPVDPTFPDLGLLLHKPVLHFLSVGDKEHPRIQGPVEAGLAARRRLVCGEDWGERTS